MYQAAELILFIQINRISGNTFLKQALEGEFPKLLRLYNDLWRRIQAMGLTVDMSGGGGGGVVQLDESIPIDIENPELLEKTALDANYE